LIKVKKILFGSKVQICYKNKAIDVRMVNIENIAVIFAIEFPNQI